MADPLRFVTVESINADGETRAHGTCPWPEGLPLPRRGDVFRWIGGREMPVSHVRFDAIATGPVAITIVCDTAPFAGL